MDKDSKERLFYIVAIVVLAFFIGRYSHKPVEKIIPTDTSKYEHTIDSLKVVNKNIQDTIIRLHKRFDSLSIVRINNHKKTVNAIKEIKSFTPNARQRWADSVARANGLK